MKENFIFYYVFGTIALLALMVGGLFTTSETSQILLTDYANAATSSAVTVSASVTVAISCANNTSTTVFGTLTSSAISTSTSNVSSTMSCANSSGGCTLYIKDAGSASFPGLYDSVSLALIESPAAGYPATATLVAGTEGFGIHATTTATGSGTRTIAAKYNRDEATINLVGGLVITGSAILASTTDATNNREFVVTHKAAVSSTTPGGTYNDTITYSCLAN